MKRTLIALLLAFSATLPVTAGDDIQKLLADMGEDDPDVRIAAREALMRDDGSGYEECRKFLEATQDADVKLHLAPIVEWLAIARYTADLERIWKERAFIETRDGKPTGIERQTGRLETRDGQRIWVLRSKATTVPPADARETQSIDRDVVTEMLHDRHMTFLSMDSSSSDGSMTRRFSVTLTGLILKARTYETPTGRNSQARQIDEFEEDEEPPRIAYINIVEYLERAVLSGHAEGNFLSFWFDDGTAVQRLRITVSRLADGTVRYRDADRKCVHLKLSGLSSEFWISTEFGLLRATWEGSVVERAEEAALQATNLDPQARRREVIRAALADILSNEDSLRLKAEETLLGMPESREGCINALASTVGPGARESLERLVHWHDPGYLREEIAAIRRERWFLAREGETTFGVERIAVDSGNPDFLVWENQAWIGSQSTDSASLRARLAPDTWMTPLEGVMTLGTTIKVNFAADAADGAVLVSTQGGRRGGSVGMRVLPFSTPNNAHSIVDTFVPSLVERAGMLRLPSLRMSVMNVMSIGGSKIYPIHVQYDGEESLSWAGTEVPTRRYRRSADSPSVNGDAWWVSEKYGLLAVQSGPVRTTRVDKATYDRAGFDPAPARLSAIDASIADLSSPELSRRYGAVATLMNQPAAKPRLQAALATATLPDAKESIQSLLDWFEPSFHADELAKMWKSRTVTWPVLGAGNGPVQFDVERAANGKGWTVELKGIKPDKRFEADCRISMDPCSLVTGRVVVALRTDDPDSANDPDFPRVVTLEPGEGGCTISIESDSGNAGSDWWEFRGKGGLPPLCGPTHLLAIERASAARLAAIDLVVWDTIFDRKTRRLRLDFAGEEEVEAHGKKVQARHYVSSGAEAGQEQEYWISDEQGIVQGNDAGREVGFEATEPKDEAK